MTSNAKRSILERIQPGASLHLDGGAGWGSPSPFRTSSDIRPHLRPPIYFLPQPTAPSDFTTAQPPRSES